MKFGKQLLSETIEEWSIHYLAYKQLKHRIYEIRDGQGKGADSVPNFELELEKQLVQTSTFYQRKEVHCEQRFEALMKRIKTIPDSPTLNIDLINSLIISTTNFAEECNALLRFATINASGFRKILKKHDKKLKKTLSNTYLPRLLRETFYEQKKLREIIVQTEIQLQLLDGYKARAVHVHAIDPAFVKQIYLAFNSNDLKTFKSVMTSTHLDHSHKTTVDQLLFKAVAEGKKDFAEFLMHQPGFSINMKDDFDRTLLHLAHTNCVPLLLQRKGVNVKAEDSNMRTPLHYYAERGMVQALQLLLEYKKVKKPKSNTAKKKVIQVVVDATDNAQYSPLLLAASKGHTECVRLLLERGAQIYLTNDNRQTSLHLATSIGSEPTVALLLKKGVSVNSLDGNQQTALHIAARFQHVAAAQTLLSFNARMDLQDHQGYTPVHLAALYGSDQMLQILFNSIASDFDRQKIVNIKDFDGCTALHVAAESNQVKCVQILMKNGADFDIKDIRGWTAEVYATWGGHLELAKTVATKETKMFLQSNDFKRTPALQTPQNPKEDEPQETKKSSRLEGLLSKVTFRIKATVQVGQFIAVLGSRKVLGSWSPTEALPLSPVNGTPVPNEETTWSGEVLLPAGLKTSYRYIILEGSRLKLWENIPNNRTLFIPPETKSITIDDGSFGVLQGLQSEESFVEGGWLVGGAQVRVRLDQNSVTLFNDNIPLSNLRAVLTTTEPLKDGRRINFPLTAPEDFSIESLYLEKLLNLEFSFYTKSGGILVGKAFTHPSQLKATFAGSLTIPIMDAKSLGILGEITFQFLVIKSFSHPNLKEVFGKSWKSIFTKSVVIGHRGAGATDSADGSKIGKYRRTHIQENTLLSFLTASHSVSFVEFDVQLSKDQVPIIFHDFFLKSENDHIKMPIETIMLEEFAQIQMRRAPVSSKLRRTNSTGTLAQMEKMALSFGIRDSLPTLEESFKVIPSTTGFNIEIKYPFVEEVEQHSLHPFERNVFVDKVLKVVFDHAGDRPILFSSFDPDVCIMLRLKQPKYPVFFLTEGTGNYLDYRCRSLKEAVDFAKSNHLMGIVTDSVPLLIAPQLISTIKKTGLFLFTYGHLNNNPKNVELQEALGVDAIILDHVAYISKHFSNGKVDGYSRDLFAS